MNSQPEPQPGTPQPAPATTQPSTNPSPPAAVQPAPGNPYSDQGFNDLAALETSVANEQTAALGAAPSSSFYYPGAGNATVTVSCTYLRMNAYRCTAADSAGDVGSEDTVVPANDGSSWTDQGMTWTGPNVTSGSYTVPSVSGWTSP